MNNLSNKIKVIVFDLDGTLINTDLYVVLNHTQLMNKYLPDFIPTLNQLIELSGPTLEETFDKYYSNVDRELLTNDFIEFSKLYSNKFSTLYENEIDTLKVLKEYGYKLCVFTSKSKERAIENLEYFKIKDYFDLIITASDVTKHKPNPEGLIMIMKHFNVDHEKLIMIGDSEVDFHASKNANTKSIITKWGLKQLPDSVKPYKFIKSYNELKEILIYE